MEAGPARRALAAGALRGRKWCDLRTLYRNQTRQPKTVEAEAPTTLRQRPDT